MYDTNRNDKIKDIYVGSDKIKEVYYKVKRKGVGGNRRTIQEVIGCIKTQALLKHISMLDADFITME